MQVEKSSSVRTLGSASSGSLETSDAVLAEATPSEIVKQTKYRYALKSPSIQTRASVLYLSLGR